MNIPRIRLRKQEDRRLRAGHLWIYSNEIETSLKGLTRGQEVIVEASDKTLLGVAYINPNSLIAARLFSRHPNDRLNTDFFINKIATAYALRQRLYVKPYYRLVFAEGDNLPGLVIDRFDEDLVLQLNTAGMDQCKDSIVAALHELLPDTRSILLRNDTTSRLAEGLEQNVEVVWGEPPETVSLEENQTLFEAPLMSGQKTGWFYDHRLNRSRLRDYVAEKKVLDVFSYLGGWGIQAAKFGAAEVTTVDSSNLSAEFISRNARLNDVSDRVQVIQEDAFEALKTLTKNEKNYDVIILDPPAFVKKQKDKKEGLIAYQRINDLALKLLAPDGILISCSCSMHVDYSELLQAVRRAGLRSGHTLQILERGHQAPDHPVHWAIPETDYLKMIISRKI